MSLRERITEDMKSAMRAGQKERLGTIRLALAAIKQRKEAIGQFQAGGRADLVAKETAEVSVLSAYLPARLSDAELDALIAEAITASGASSPKDMGKVMALVKTQSQGRADMGAVSARVKEKLTAR